MNKAILIGRLTKDPVINFTAQPDSKAIARYTLAVDRRFKKDEADFISCVVFGKGAEFAQKYLTRGTKISVVGRIQTGSYTNREGQKVYTTDVIVEEQEFAESKNAKPQNTQPDQNASEGFMSIPDGIDEELPFV